MRRVISIVCIQCLVTLAVGQTLKGKISDGLQALPMATVTLLHMDSSLVKGVITNSAGEFAFENITSGKYMISTSMIGYSRFLAPVTIDRSEVVLPEIVMKEASTALGEITVEGEKQMFEQQIDRLVINVQRSITSSGNTILEVLQKSPGIVVNRQTNGISMNGKSGVRLMINGKLMQVPMDVVVQMLDGMNSSNIEKIELITTPPSKYDAEGNGGIINIVTKQNLEAGTNASFGLTLGARWAETIGGSFNVNHRGKRIGWFVDYSYLRNHNQHISKMIRESFAEGFTQKVVDDSPRENWTTQQNLSAGVEWAVSKKTLVTAGITGYRRNWELNAMSYDVNQVRADSTALTDMKIHEANVWQSATGSLGLETKINEKNLVSFNIDYLYYNNDNPSQYENTARFEHQASEISQVELTKKTPIHFLIAKADYQWYVSKTLSFEAGLKGVTSKLNNDVGVTHIVNNVSTRDPLLSSSSDLREQIGAAYLSGKWEPASSWNVNGGLRYEYTHTAIGTPTERNLINRKYGFLFPTLFITKAVGAETDLQVSYSRRITRPTYNDMAPFIFLWGPNTFSGGNTSLLPAIADAVRIGYHVRALSLSAQYTHSRREINSFQPDIDSRSNTLTYRSQNMKYLNTLSVTGAYSATITNWWELQMSVTAQYQTVHAGASQQYSKFNLYGLNANVTNVIRLPHDFAFEIGGFYQSKSIAGITTYAPMGSLNAGIQKKMGQGTLKLAMDDILYTNYWRIKSYSPENNINTFFKYDFHNQFVRITYAYNLGRNKMKTVKLRSGADEERNRVN